MLAPGAARVVRDPSCGVTPLNSPRAGRQQGQAGSGGCAGGPRVSRSGRLSASARRRPVSVPVATLPDVATALYRRYRPETFAEVIGQEHVTDPLRSALRAGRVGHAYLFSGPRGCGKTTSARILARCLNCAQGPTDTPCGACDSCVELARGGPGSLDVVEIDAASHGGVDDARELRDRATFATARDRFKVFIIDEAHMVSPQGFNALLKIVEEPPPHVKFVFATTEPDKVLGTIRSRTHHYPFHLVPPERLQSYLAGVCEAEGVPVGPGVLQLVVRAGAGSVRDSLSVLDQLAAGSDESGIDYAHAIALLGYTPAALLDDVITALAVGDGATVFRVVDRVVQAGQDPRRFVDDLLQRLRDLIIVDAVGERAAEVFPDCPQDQLERMAQQAAAYGTGPLSRAADLANAASTEMSGATSPRLHLELLGARMLLPAADDAERGLAARLDRLERRLSVPSGAPRAVDQPPARVAAAPAAVAPEAAPPRAEVPQVEVPAPGRASAAEGAPVEAPAAVGPEEVVAAAVAVAAAGEDEASCPAVAASGGGSAGPGAPDSTSTAESTEAVRRMWPDVLEHLAGVRRRTWTRVSHDAQVLEVDEQRLVLQFHKPGPLAAFTQGAHADYVRESLVAVLGLDRVVVAVAEGGAPPRPAQAGPAAPRAEAPDAVRSAPLVAGGARRSDRPGAPAGAPTGARSAPTPGWDGPPPSDDDAPPPYDEEPPPDDDRRPVRRSGGAAGGRAPETAPARSTRAASPGRPAPPVAVPGPTASAAGVDDEPSRDDADAEDSGLVGAALVERLLGGRLITDDAGR